MLVARRGELATVRDRLGRATPTLVLGEAGIGKTALLRTASSEAGARLFEGGGLASLSFSSYLPLAQAMGRSPEGDPAAVAAWAEARIGDGILLIDDLQWCDPDTLAVIPLLAGKVKLLSAVRLGDPSSPGALGHAERCGFEVLRLEPLAEAEARELVRCREPALEDEVVEQVVHNAGGNPFLLEMLAANGRGRPTLELVLGARLRRCSPAAQEAMALLALLGRPADRALLGPGSNELVESGLARGEDEISMRHALLSEQAVRSLDAETRRRLHARLARAVGDAGESARHHEAAGEREAAHKRALEAARAGVRESERARHLELAARCAEGPDADALRLEAASALVDAGEAASAEALLDEVVAADAGTRAAEGLWRGLARLAAGDQEAAREQLDAALELAAGSRTPIEVRLRVERVWPALWAFEAERAVGLAEEAAELADAVGAHEARAQLVLGTAGYLACSPECEGHLERARVTARDSDQHALELQAAATLAAAYRAFGHSEATCALADEMEARAKSLSLRHWEMLFRWMRARVDVLWRGDHDAIPELELIAQEPTLGPHLDQARSDLALALGYAARFPDARRVLEDGLAQAGSARGAAILRMIESEVEFEAGRFERAYEAAEETLAGAPGVMTGGFALLYRAWACMETGRPVPSDALAGPAPPLLAPAEVEIEALRALQDPSRAAEAEALFDESARGWESGLVHRELRARWGAAEAARRADESGRAVERLLALEERVEAMTLPGFAGRVRRSLREAGVARASAGNGDGLLSAREREVMELVSQGLTSREMAQRLGVSPSTVETQVTSAMRKLKASTRKQAASLAAALD